MSSSSCDESTWHSLQRSLSHGLYDSGCNSLWHNFLTPPQHFLEREVPIVTTAQPVQKGSFLGSLSTQARHYSLQEVALLKKTTIMFALVADNTGVCSTCKDCGNLWYVSTGSTFTICIFPQVTPQIGTKLDFFQWFNLTQDWDFVVPRFLYLVWKCVAKDVNVPYEVEKMISDTAFHNRVRYSLLRLLPLHSNSFRIFWLIRSSVLVKKDPFWTSGETKAIN